MKKAMKLDMKKAMKLVNQKAISEIIPSTISVHAIVIGTGAWV
jgi:hypothetical protein